MRKYQTGTAALEIIEQEPAEPLRVFVMVNAGIVEAIYSTDKAAQVEVIDHDNPTKESAQARDLLNELYEAQAAHMVY